MACCDQFASAAIRGSYNFILVALSPLTIRSHNHARLNWSGIKNLPSLFNLCQGRRSLIASHTHTTHTPTHTRTRTHTHTNRQTRFCTECAPKLQILVQQPACAAYNASKTPNYCGWWVCGRPSVCVIASTQLCFVETCTDRVYNCLQSQLWSSQHLHGLRALRRVW